MTTTWTRSAVVAALGWAMLASPAEATVISYNFSAPITGYLNSSGYNTPTGTFAGSVSVDTTRLALSDIYREDGSNGYVEYRSFDTAIRPVTFTTAVSGTPDDALANSLLGRAPTGGLSTLFQGTGTGYLNSYGPSYFRLRFEEYFNADSTAADGTTISSFDLRQIIIIFLGAETMIVDGYVLPTAGSGTVVAALDRSRGFSQDSSDGEDIGSYESVILNANGGQTTAGAVPEPAALGLLGLGMLGVAIRRRRG